MGGFILYRINIDGRQYYRRRKGRGVTWHKRADLATVINAGSMLELYLTDAISANDDQAVFVALEQVEFVPCRMCGADAPVTVCQPPEFPRCYTCECGDVWHF